MAADERGYRDETPLCGGECAVPSGFVTDARLDLFLENCKSDGRGKETNGGCSSKELEAVSTVWIWDTSFTMLIFSENLKSVVWSVGTP